MRNVFITAVSVALLSTASWAAEVSGEIETKIAENASGDVGATTSFEIGIAADGIANGSIKLVDGDNGIDVDEYKIGTSIAGIDVHYGDHDPDTWVGAEGEHTLAAPAMAESFTLRREAAQISIGLTDVEADLTDISNVQGSYKLTVAGLDTKIAADYNLDAENTVLGAQVGGLELGVANVGGALTYDFDAETIAYEGTAETLYNITVYVNGDDEDSVSNIGAGYDTEVGGLEIGADINYDLNTEEYTPSVTASFSF